MRRWIISLLVMSALLPSGVMADDSLQVSVSHYDSRMERYQRFWNSLIPSQVVGQNAGNMGFLSLGVGWDYGKRNQWETHFMVGFVPKRNKEPMKATLTLKENFIPCRNRLNEKWEFEPLTTGLYLNAIFGEEFWNHQPSRYPNNYYWFSTRVRTNIFIGQRVTRTFEVAKRRHAKSVTLFYELSSCDLYLYEYLSNKHISLQDVLGLSVGFKAQLF